MKINGHAYSGGNSDDFKNFILYDNVNRMSLSVF